MSEQKSKYINVKSLIAKNYELNFCRFETIEHRLNQKLKK